MGEVCAGHIKAFGFSPFPHIKGNSVLKASLLGRYAMHSPHCIIIDCTDLPTRRASSGGGGGGTGVVVVPALLIFIIMYILHTAAIMCVLNI